MSTPASHQFPRRPVLKLAAVGAMSMPLLAAAPAVSAASTGSDRDSSVDAVVGTIIAISEEGLTISSSAGTHTIKAAPRARMYSGAFGGVDSIADFILGDRIAAEGTQHGSVMTALSIGSTYAEFSAVVESVSSDGSQAYTRQAVIDLEGGRLPFTDPPSGKQPVQVGQTLSGLIWRDPRSGQTYLLVQS